MLRRAALLALTLWLGAAGGVQAQQWSEYAFISGTLGVSDSRICIGEASRGELGCPSYAPTVSPTGRVNMSSGLTVDSVSLTTAGTTWGYLGSAASYIPNLNTNNISLSTINGVSVTNLGGASPTNVPAFRVHKNGTAQTLTTSTYQLLTWSAKDIDTYNNFNTGTGRFTPTVAGYYLVHLAIGCSNGANTNACVPVIRKNGANYSVSNVRSPQFDVSANTTALVYMNGTTDYLEAFGYWEASSAVISGSSAHTNFSGSLVASGNGLVSGTGATSLAGLGDVTLSSPASGQVLTYNGSAWVNATPSATSLISGTTTMVPGWPDAIVCNFTTPNWGVRVIPLSYAPWNGDGRYIYRFTDGAGTNTEFFGIVYNTNGSFYANDYQTPGGVQPSASSCSNKSISQLYAEGKAFNFIGNTGQGGGGALGDRLTSGTLAVTANSSTAIISLTTNGTT